MNQEIEHYLRVFINYHQNDWHEWLQMAEFIYNDWEHSATKVTPFFIDNGQHLYKGTSPRVQSTNDTAQSFADGMRKVWEESAALEKTAANMKKNYDKHRHTRVNYKSEIKSDSKGPISAQIDQ